MTLEQIIFHTENEVPSSLQKKETSTRGASFVNVKGTSATCSALKRFFLQHIKFHRLNPCERTLLPLRTGSPRISPNPTPSFLRGSASQFATRKRSRETAQNTTLFPSLIVHGARKKKGQRKRRPRPVVVVFATINQPRQRE